MEKIGRDKGEWEEKREQDWGKLHLWFLATAFTIEQTVAHENEVIDYDGNDDNDDKYEGDSSVWLKSLNVMRRRIGRDTWHCIALAKCRMQQRVEEKAQ